MLDLRNNLLRYATVGHLACVFWCIALVSIFFADTLNDMVTNIGLLCSSILLGCMVKRAVAEEQQKKQQLSEMLSFASHELRTPITTIFGYISMIYEGDTGSITKKQRDVIGALYNTTEHLTQIVEDFLSTSKIEQGRLGYEMHEHDLAEILKEARDGFRSRFRSEVRFSIEIDGRQPHRIFCDRQKIRHVIFNLIDNAIKYTERGSIRLRLTKDKKGMVLLEVADTGAGIARADLEVIFQKFRRGENGIVSRGSGIGLYLAKSIVEAHNGRIWAESAGLGKGSLFTVALPEAKLLEEYCHFDFGDRTKSSCL